MKKVTLINTDITELAVDAIVNSANKSLLGGGGLDYIFQKKAGKMMQDECRAIHKAKGGCPTGQAEVTVAGDLPAKFIIHAVGPRWLGGTKNEEELLFSTYHHSLMQANHVKARTVSFPSISTGIYRFPKQRAAEIAISTIFYMLPEYLYVDHVFLVCTEQENYQIYLNILSNIEDEKIEIEIVS